MRIRTIRVVAAKVLLGYIYSLEEMNRVNMDYRKVYVDVFLAVTADGRVWPRKIRYEDGKIYPIDRVVCACKAASTKVGGLGTRYTVIIHGHETYLFDERGRWFVEAKIVVV